MNQYHCVPTSKNHFVSDLDFAIILQSFGKVTGRLGYLFNMLFFLGEITLILHDVIY